MDRLSDEEKRQEVLDALDHLKEITVITFKTDNNREIGWLHYCGCYIRIPDNARRAKITCRCGIEFIVKLKNTRTAILYRAS